MRDAPARAGTSTETEAARPGLRAPFSGALTPRAARRLSKLIAAKLALDLIFVAALAAYAYADTFRNPFDGAIEQADGRVVRGRVVVHSVPGAPVEVQLFVDGRFAAAGLADKQIAEGSTGDPAASTGRGFLFEFDPPLYGEHEVRVYAVRAGRGGARRTLRQVGAPRVFVWR